MADGVVKIDKEIEREIERFLKKPENKFKFTTKKQVVNLATVEFLKSFSWNPSIKNAEKLANKGKRGKNGR